MVPFVPLLGRLGVPLGYAQSALSAVTASNLPSIASGAIGALITIEAQNARWRDDGTDPTTTVGMLVNAGGGFNASFFYYTGKLGAMRWIGTVAGSILNVTYYG